MDKDLLNRLHIESALVKLVDNNPKMKQRVNKEFAKFLRPQRWRPVREALLERERAIGRMYLICVTRNLRDPGPRSGDR